jgi:hypothetical protein
MVNKPRQDGGEPLGRNLTHPGVGVSNKGYQADRSSASIKVRFSARDIEHLSDCDDTVRALLERAQSVELSFSFDDLEWVRKEVSPKNNGWGQTPDGVPNNGLPEPRDVTTQETKVANDLVITMQHKRGL